ncbi:hypothetical protein AB0M36_34820 [Actinoplanes sp. NPDC051346]|uniref:hypothetical protein n=1 Tax=Actinoplanes sp. NPDC051346 TaxID=3155048 RepID=UPI003431112E
MLKNKRRVVCGQDHATRLRSREEQKSFPRAYRRIATVAAGTVLVLVTWSSSAAAHEVSAWHGLDMAWVGANHAGVYVSDHECDGHGVYATYNLSSGSSGGVRDPDGCGSAVGYVPTTVVVSFDVCEDTVGCSPLVRVT